VIIELKAVAAYRILLYLDGYVWWTGRYTGVLWPVYLIIIKTTATSDLFRLNGCWSVHLLLARLGFLLLFGVYLFDYLDRVLFILNYYMLSPFASVIRSKGKFTLERTMKAE